MYVCMLLYVIAGHVKQIGLSSSAENLSLTFEENHNMIKTMDENLTQYACGFWASRPIYEDFGAWALSPRSKYWEINNDETFKKKM